MKLNQQYEIEQQELQKFIKEFESIIVKQETGKLEFHALLKGLRNILSLIS